MSRFTIRDLLWLTVVVALAVGWWLEHRGHTVARAGWKMSQDKLETLAQMVRRRGFDVKIDGGGVGIESRD